MKKQTTFFAMTLALLAFPILAALPPQYADTPVQKDYPKADVVVLHHSQAYTLLPDGRVELKVRTVEKVLNYEGVDIVGDPKIAFNSKSQELKITRSRTWTPGGLAVDTQANGFNEMTPFALEKAPAYTDIRQMVVTHVGIEVGSIIELEYAITDKAAWRRFMDGVEPVRGEHPTLVREVIIAVPEGTPLKYAVQSGSGEPTRTKANGRDIYTWAWKDLTAIREADTTPAEKAFAPRLLFSTSRDWAAQVASLAPVVAKAAQSLAPEMKKNMDDLLKGASGDLEKVARLQNYVSTAFRTIEWPLKDFGFKPRSAAEIYDSGYGHSLDKAVLLASLLTQAGFQPVVGVAGHGPQPVVPCMDNLDSALVRVECGGSAVALDPAAKLAERYQKDLAGMWILPLQAGHEDTHAMPGLGVPDLLDLSIEAKVSEDLALEGTAVLTLDGWYSPYWAVRGSEEELKGAMGGILAGPIPGAEVTSVSVIRMDPGTCAFKVAFKAKAPKTPGPVKSLKVGSPEASALNKVPGWHRSERDLPVVLPCSANETMTLKLTLPEKIQPKALPRDVNIENSAGRATQTASFKDGAITVTRSVTVPNRTVPAASWTDLRALFNTLCADPARLVIF